MHCLETMHRLNLEHARDELTHTGASPTTLAKVCAEIAADHPTSRDRHAHASREKSKRAQRAAARQRKGQYDAPTVGNLAALRAILAQCPELVDHLAEDQEAREALIVLGYEPTPEHDEAMREATEETYLDDEPAPVDAAIGRMMSAEPLDRKVG